MKSVSYIPNRTVNNAVPTTHSRNCEAAMRHGVKKALRWSVRVGARPSIAQRRSLTVRVVIHQLPNASATTA